jgi:hypothetical protein
MHEPARIASRAFEGSGGGDRLRKVGDEHCDEEGDADRAGLENRQAEDERLRNAVEDDPEHERPPRLGPPASGRLAARRSMSTSAPKKRAEPPRRPSATPPSPAEVSKGSCTSSYATALISTPAPKARSARRGDV